MIPDFSKILDATKLPLRWWAILAIFFGFLLFLPEKYLELFSLKNIIEEYKPFISGAFLLSITILFVNLAFSTSKLVNDFRKKKKNKRITEEKINKSIKELESLSVYEASVLVYCYTNNQKTVNLPISNGYVRALVDKHHLKTIGGYGDMLEWPHTVQSHIWDYIPTLIEKFDKNELQQSFRYILNPYGF